MAQTLACPECGETLQVPGELLGKLVQCPQCKHSFTATADETPTPAEPVPVDSAVSDDRPKESSRRPVPVDNDDEDAPPPSIKKDKPGRVTAIGAMALAGGITAVTMFLVLGGATGGFCCIWPGTYYSLVVGILAIIRGGNILGDRAHEQPLPKNIAIMLMVNIINGDVTSFVLGIIMMVFCGEKDVIDYFKKPSPVN
jgi:hypothetical protein